MTEITLLPKLISRQQAKQLGLTRYYTGQACKNGHTEERLVSNGRCAGCLKDWKKSHKDDTNRAQRKHREAHSERWKKLGRDLYWKHVEKRREHSRNYSRKKAALKPKKLITYRSPIVKDIADRMRCRMWHALQAGKGRKGLEAVLGYGLEDLKIHLERQFMKGMSWENRSEWDIDHIVPVASFNFEGYDDPEFRVCWAMTNLRPLWKKDNRRKWAHREHLL